MSPNHLEGREDERVKIEGLTFEEVVERVLATPAGKESTTADASTTR
jgi:hypothetical protein